MAVVSVRVFRKMVASPLLTLDLKRGIIQLLNFII